MAKAWRNTKKVTRDDGTAVRVGRRMTDHMQQHNLFYVDSLLESILGRIGIDVPKPTFAEYAPIQTELDSI